LPSDPPRQHRTNLAEKTDKTNDAAESDMEVKRHLIHDTRLGLFVTAQSLESANMAAARMNRLAGYPRFVARTISELK
jgi:hypothetical protein